MEHQFTLEKYNGKNRFACPNCGKKELALYINIETNEYLNEDVGRCNREQSCGYHLKPKEYFQAGGEPHNNIENLTDRANRIFQPKSTPIIQKECYHETDLMLKTLKAYEQNNFVQFLKNSFSDAVTDRLVNRFKIGTTKHFEGGTVFWYIDKNEVVRAGKIMQYNAMTGKREKTELEDGTKKPKISYVHSILKIQDYQITKTLFGEHQLNYENSKKPIAICESEKTAILSSLYFGGFVWLACGSLSNLTAERLKPLEGRKIMLFPDCGIDKGNGTPFGNWSKKAEAISKELNCQINISNFLEKYATDEQKEHGLDLADFLLERIDRTFGHSWVLTENDYPKFWDL